jgi:very-short-patch-repair endonuclease
LCKWPRVPVKPLRPLLPFEIPLCLPRQEEFKVKSQQATPLAVALFKQLKRRGVPAELEKWDGNKTIDIAVVDAKVNIEVDGGQHNFNADQAMADLFRTLHAFKRGYLTLRVPNSLVKYNLERTADLITEFLVESKEQLEENELPWKW